jgi:hypothetical protein
MLIKNTFISGNSLDEFTRIRSDLRDAIVKRRHFTTYLNGNGMTSMDIVESCTYDKLKEYDFTRQA